MTRRYGARHIRFRSLLYLVKRFPFDDDLYLFSMLNLYPIRFMVPSFNDGEAAVRLNERLGRKSMGWSWDRLEETKEN